MMPFFGVGGDQAADSWLGEPGIGDTENARGSDGTIEMSNLVKCSGITSYIDFTK
jgi:hypothetical protein